MIIMVHQPEGGVDDWVQQELAYHPTHFEFAIETDASWVSAVNIAGIGVVIKDKHGQMTAVGCSPTSASSVLAAEREAVLEGLCLAADKRGLRASGSDRSDCHQVVKALNNYDAMPWLLRNIL
ncbi:hypothetical protein GW17_00034982 [Ensete ventricosum]|nr:hypothetical protein GW17_00034982 [Ensete ventricosum]